MSTMRDRPFYANLPTCSIIIHKVLPLDSLKRGGKEKETLYVSLVKYQTSNVILDFG